jgi:hypothetical protein
VAPLSLIWGWYALFGLRRRRSSLLS